MRQFLQLFRPVLPQVRRLRALGWRVLPILSCSAAALDTRFGTAAALRAQLQEMTGETPLTTLQQVEPLGPKGMAQALIIAPATGHHHGQRCGSWASWRHAGNPGRQKPACCGADGPLFWPPPPTMRLSGSAGYCPAAAAAELLLCALRPGRQLQKALQPQLGISPLIPDTLESALRGVQLQPILL